MQTFIGIRRNHIQPGVHIMKLAQGNTHLSTKEIEYIVKKLKIVFPSGGKQSPTPVIRQLFPIALKLDLDQSTFCRLILTHLKKVQKSDTYGLSWDINNAIQIPGYFCVLEKNTAALYYQYQCDPGKLLLEECLEFIQSVGVTGSNTHYLLKKTAYPNLRDALLDKICARKCTARNTLVWALRRRTEEESKTIHIADIRNRVGEKRLRALLEIVASLGKVVTTDDYFDILVGTTILSHRKSARALGERVLRRANIVTKSDDPNETPA